MACLFNLNGRILKERKKKPSQLHPNSNLLRGKNSGLFIYVCMDSFVSCLTEMSMDLTLNI